MISNETQSVKPTQFVKPSKPLNPARAVIVRTPHPDSKSAHQRKSNHNKDSLAHTYIEAANVLIVIVHLPDKLCRRPPKHDAQPPNPTSKNSTETQKPASASPPRSPPQQNALSFEIRARNYESSKLAPRHDRETIRAGSATSAFPSQSSTSSGRIVLVAAVTWLGSQVEIIMEGRSF